MSGRPAMARARLVEIPAGTELLRAVRFMHAEDFTDCTTDELTTAARWLRAAAYSATEGARRLDAIIRTRQTNDTTGTTPCTFDPTTTPPSTNTDAPPTATPPPPAPRSRSTRKKTEPE